MNDNSENESALPPPLPDQNCDAPCVKTLCQYCGGPIQFLAHEFGAMADCPHCKRTIALGMIQTKCSHCNKPIQFEERSIGGPGVCPHCYNLFEKPLWNPPEDDAVHLGPVRLLAYLAFIWALIAGVIYCFTREVSAGSAIGSGIAALVVVGYYCGFGKNND